MKLRMLKAGVINGSVWPNGSILELPEAQAQALIEGQRAEAVPEIPPVPMPEEDLAQLPAPERKEKKKV